MRVLIACGGTGGHIFPGLSLYNALKKRQGDVDILLVLDKRAVSSLIIPEDYPRIYISLIPIRFNLQIPFVVLKLIKGVFQSLWVILRFKPKVIVGFGGYASFFIIFFARILRIKTLIHESNVSPGRANRILAYFVNEITSGFVKTKDYFGINSFKVKFIGNLLRPNLTRIEKTRACEFLGLHPNGFTILVMGGSQGAHRINTVFLEAVSLIKDKSRFQVIHLCGRQDLPFLENGYKDLGIKARVFAFFSQMEYVYSATDIVISRAGATSISEIAFFSLPSILIPYPYACRHQTGNAWYLCQNYTAILIEEKDLNPEILKDKILELLNNLDLQKLTAKNVPMFSKAGAEESLTDLVLEVSG